MRENKIRQVSLLIFMIIFGMSLFQTNLLEAAISSAGYDFGQVEVGSTITTTISITNLEDSSITITSFVFVNADCNDFSVVSTPESMIIPPNGTIEAEVGFTPSTTGTCSDTLRIYTGSPFPYSVTLMGTGIEAISDQTKPFNIRQSYLTQDAKIAKLNAKKDRKLSKIAEEYERELDKAYRDYQRDASDEEDKDKAEAKFQKKQAKLQRKYEKKQKDIQKWYDEKLVKIEKKKSKLD